MDGKRAICGEPAGPRWRNKSGSRTLAFRIIREAVMQLGSGFWPDYDPLALVVMVVGILAITTWALSF
jgi:hypothetical protein